MDPLSVIFPESGVRTWVFLPPLFSFVVSFFTSMAGVSGAFLVLPFQVSVLGFTSPAVTATNFVYNIVAIPSGVYRYFREGRLFPPLAWIIIAGTLPGVFLGYYLRVLYLPDPGAFKVFVGCVLLYVGGRLLWDVLRQTRLPSPHHAGAEPVGTSAVLPRSTAAVPRPESSLGSVVRTIAFTLRTVEYEYRDLRYRFSVPAMFSLSLAVGIIGGAYGIGGGAIIAPFCVAVFRLPVHTIAGAALFGTFVTSVVGVIFYSVLPAQGGVSTSPDWALGFLFGVGGFAGMYLGARLQKFFPQRFIAVVLGIMILALAFRYILQYFL